MNRDLPELDAMRRYEAEKAAWIARNPEDTPREYEQAMRAIAQRVGV